MLVVRSDRLAADGDQLEKRQTRWTELTNTEQRTKLLRYVTKLTVAVEASLQAFRLTTAAHKLQRQQNLQQPDREPERERERERERWRPH